MQPKPFFALVALVAIGVFSSLARADVVGSVLYPLDAPNGYSNAALVSIANNPPGSQTVGNAKNNGTGNTDALMWSSPDGAAVDLAPSGFAGNTYAVSSDGVNQVGNGSDAATGHNAHALLWSGTAASNVDLNPTGLITSFATGVSGTQQVGYGEDADAYYHAVIWTGTAASAVDLAPIALFGNSAQALAYGTNGTKQVGAGDGGVVGDVYHALLWTGTAASAVDLNPSTLLGASSSSEALAVSPAGTQQVGFAQTLQGGNGYEQQAILWTGTAGSAVNLEPTLLTSSSGSVAYATNGIQQAGYEFIGGTNATNAVLWSGTAASAVDLQSLLPADGTWTESYAYAIDASGDVFGIADGTYDDVTGAYAVEWSPVPEPASASLLLLAGLGLSVRRARRGQPTA